MFKKALKIISFVSYFLVVFIKENVKLLHIQFKFWKNSVVTVELHLMYFVHQQHQKEKKG